MLMTPNELFDMLNKGVDQKERKKDREEIRKYGYAKSWLDSILADHNDKN